MSHDQFRNILDQFPGIVQVHLQGLGEPLLNQDFFRMVIEAKERGIYVSTFTNATLISEKTARMIVASGLDQLWFSIDGATPETYEDIRVGSSLDRVKENIKKVVTQNEDSRTRLGIWFVAMNRNIHELPLLPILAAELGIHNLRVELIDSFGKSMLGTRASLLFGSKPDLARLTDYCRKAAKASRSSNLGLSFNPRIVNAIDSDKLSQCWWPWLSVYVTAEGFITPCCRRPDPRMFTFGNLFKKRFLEIWNSPEYQTFRYGLTRGKIPEVCRECLFACHTGFMPLLKYLSSFA